MFVFFILGYLLLTTPFPQALYSKLPNISVEELRLRESDLNTERMLDLMAVGSVTDGANMPLYIYIVSRILRDIRLQQEKDGRPFDYKQFKHILDNENLNPGQRGPLKQRLDNLESFMVQDQVKPSKVYGSKSKKNKDAPENIWTPMVISPPCLIFFSSIGLACTTLVTIRLTRFAILARSIDHRGPVLSMCYC